MEEVIDQYKREKEKQKEKLKGFELIKEYDNFSLYKNKKSGYKECFK